MHITKAPKTSQVKNIWLSYTLCFLGSHVIQAFSMTFIGQLDCTSYSFDPKLFKHFLGFEHVSYHIEDASIFSLHYAILLWRSRHC